MSGIRREGSRFRSIVVVGASVAGSRLAIELRARGYDGAITLVDADEYWPYDKPPLSKQALLEGLDAVPTLLTAQRAAELDLTVRLGARAVALDPHEHTVVFDDGSRLHADAIVVATGVEARRLPTPPGMHGVHVLRTLDDAAALRDELVGATRVGVVGAGFIGAEFASAARERGIDVTVVEALDIPLSHVLGPVVGAELASLHALHGTTLVTGTAFAGFRGGSRVEALALADGREFPVDLAVVGIGATPAVGWLAGSGLPLGNGIDVDEDFAVEGFPGVYAIGDVAHRRTADGRRSRVEHWTTANEHAAHLAAVLTGTAPSPAQPAYVWSDQYGTRIQILGSPRTGRLAQTSGSVADGRFTAVWVDQDDRIVGALAVGDNKATMAFRKAMRAGERFVVPAAS